MPDQANWNAAAVIGGGIALRGGDISQVLMAGPQ